MISFSAKVKNELVHIKGDDDFAKRAETAGLLRMAATISLNSNREFGIVFESENAAVSRKLLTLLKESAPSIRVEITVRRSKRLRKHNSYVVRVLPSAKSNEILDGLGFLSMRNLLDAKNDKSLLKDNDCVISYLRGAFLAGGSVNSPDGQYHLEFVCPMQRFAEFLLEILRSMYLPANMTERKNDYIVYIKEGEAILDLLSMMGIGDELIEFYESARNLKEIRSQVNRLVNCETANLHKTIEAATRQVDIIKSIKDTKIWLKLTAKLRETAEIRLKNPEAAISELAQIAKCSRSAMNHRLRKIEEIAKNYREI